MSTGYQQVIALNAETGEKIWEYNSPHPPALRGVGYLARHYGVRSGDSLWHARRVLGRTRRETGKLTPGFGDGGMVNLRTGQVSESYPRFAVSSPPAFYKNYVIPGCAPGEQPAFGASCDVRAFDMRSGKVVWTFHTVPRPGELNHDVWKDGQWENRSGANSRGFMTVDVERGMIFVPLGTPNKDFFGADREGSNLYGTCIVALDANTGKLKWYFQTTHHDNWDYDESLPPILVTVKHGGRKFRL